MNALIPTIAELKEELYQYISDASKDAWGFRTRMDISGMTIEQLMKEADFWEGEVVRAIKEEKSREAYAIAEFEVLIEDTIAMGAGDRETAIRWLKTADDWFENDEGYFEYHYGLPYGYVKNPELRA
jgi:hypothetical protein